MARDIAVDKIADARDHEYAERRPAQRVVPPLQSSSTINTGIRTTRTNVILLAVVINIILRNSYQFSIIHIDDAHAHKVTRFDVLLRREPDLPSTSGESAYVRPK